MLTLMDLGLFIFDSLFTFLPLNITKPQTVQAVAVGCRVFEHSIERWRCRKKLLHLNFPCNLYLTAVKQKELRSGKKTSTSACCTLVLVPRSERSRVELISEF